MTQEHKDDWSAIPIAALARLVFSWHNSCLNTAKQRLAEVKETWPSDLANWGKTSLPYENVRRGISLLTTTDPAMYESLRSFVFGNTPAPFGESAEPAPTATPPVAPAVPALPPWWTALPMEVKREVMSIYYPEAVTISWLIIDFEMELRLGVTATRTDAALIQCCKVLYQLHAEQLIHWGAGQPTPEPEPVPAAVPAQMKAPVPAPVVRRYPKAGKMPAWLAAVGTPQTVPVIDVAIVLQAWLHKNSCKAISNPIYKQPYTPFTTNELSWSGTGDVCHTVHNLLQNMLNIERTEEAEARKLCDAIRKWKPPADSTDAMTEAAAKLKEVQRLLDGSTDEDEEEFEEN